jgi:hypothetical protein
MCHYHSLPPYPKIGRLVPTRVEPLMGVYSNSRFLSLPTNIRLGWKCIEVSNTQAYYNMGTIAQAPRERNGEIFLFLKEFKIP